MTAAKQAPVSVVLALGPVLLGAGCMADAGGPTYAEAPALEQALRGSSYVGTLPDGSAVCIYHAPDGRFLGRADGLVSGQWSVAEEGLCYAYVQGREHGDCRQVALAGDRAALFAAGVVIGQGHIAEGNVCA